MKHYIEDKIYYIKDDNNEVVLKIELPELGNMITITTDKEVYSGPIGLIYFKEDPPKEECNDAFDRVPMDEKNERL